MASTPTSANDTINGNATSNDSINGLAGDDSIYGFGGRDSLLGGLGNDYLDGGADNDSLTGGGGNDTMFGGTGADTMTGEGGDDTYYVDSTLDSVREAAGGGLNDKILYNMISATTVTMAAEVEIATVLGSLAVNVTGNGSANFITGNDNANTLSGLVGNDNLYGMGGNDILIGGANDDMLDGGLGNDNLQGGTGNDTYVFANDGSTDSYTEKAGEGADTIISHLKSFTLSTTQEVEHLTLAGPAALNGTGNALANKIQGNDLGNVLLGLDGNDSLFGYGSNDDLLGGNGNDSLDGGSGDDTLTGDLGNDTLQGGDGNDTLRSFSNPAAVQSGSIVVPATEADSLEGGLGDDRFEITVGRGVAKGGAGNDVYVLSTSSGFTIQEDAGAGIDTVVLTKGHTAYSIANTNLEDIANLDGAVNIKLTGNTLNNYITSSSGRDTLQGDIGSDTLDGGAGDDSLEGGADNDRLTGGLGTDTLVGGTGDDTYVLMNDGSTDTITEQAGAGSDTIVSDRQAIDLNQFSNIENVELLTSGAIFRSITGTRDQNKLSGSAGSDAMYGRAGNDTLLGLGGNDLLLAGDGNDSVEGGSENDTLEGGLGADTLLGGLGDDSIASFSSLDIDAIAAGSLIVPITDVDVIDAGDGNDTIDILVGRGTAAGGKGDDTYIISDLSNFSISEKAGEGIDLVLLQGDIASYSLEGTELEDIAVGAGSNAITLRGNSAGNYLQSLEREASMEGLGGDDTLEGGVGNDRLDGGLGNDMLMGGGGNDTYVLMNDGSTDTITEQAGAGSDTIVSDRQAIDLNQFSNIENVELLTSGAIFRRITGTSDQNKLNGSAGSDAMYSRAGNDTLLGLGGNDLLLAGDGNDSVEGGSENDTLEGGLGADTLLGGLGDDSIASFSSQDIDAIAAGSLIVPITDIDVIDAGDGNDTIDILVGRGTAAGGKGDDIYIISDLSNFSISEKAGEGIDLVVLQGEYTSFSVEGTEIEDIFVGANNQSIELRGSSVGNYLQVSDGQATVHALSGADTLDGGSGNNMLYGGTGDDVYVHDAQAAGLHIYENIDEGIDTLQSYFNVDFLADNVENLKLEYSAEFASVNQLLLGIDLYAMGNELANGIEGSVANDLLLAGGNDDTVNGNAGNDEIYGEAGNDLMNGGFGDDLLLGGDGNDKVSGANGADFLFGDSGQDTLSGGDDSDAMDGGADNDLLMGGLGDDVYQLIDNFGEDTISENDGLSGGNDQLSFASAGRESLWLTRSGNSLVIDVVGTSNRVTVSDWFTNSNAQIEKITDASSGLTLNASSVNSLVNAMASFSPQMLNSGAAPASLVSTWNQAWVAA